MTQINDLLDKLNGLEPWAQWAFGIIATLITIGLVRFMFQKVVLKFVRKTYFDWDNKLYSPVTTRIYLFIAITGVVLTTNWILGEEHSAVIIIDPIIQASYILLSTSLLSAT
jgi:hypothetical protein